jgi:glycosyltransferase involved in cell wall biosynthesis
MQNKKKKILWMADDFRSTTGVGTISREIVLGLIHKYDFAYIGGSGTHPEEGKVVNMADAIKKETGVQDAYCMLYPVSGYGNQNLLKQIIQHEKPDVIMHFTDPRFWGWLYQIEHELRQHLPIMYYTIWDSVPYPMYNNPYYRSCDSLLCISKQTENICKNVLGESNWIDLETLEETKDFAGKSLVHYVPHGSNPKIFKPIFNKEDVDRVDTIKKQLFGDKKFKYVIFYNNRNIQRKRVSNIILGYRTFLESLPEEERSSCVLLLHTTIVDNSGTDLFAVKEALCPDGNVVFSESKVSPEDLNALYNIADVTISASSNEGWGISTTESILAGTVTIMPSVGGQQDQIGHTTDDGGQLEFSGEWGTNSDGRYKNHGVWTKVLYPTCRTVQGSPPTPYIFDELVDWKDIAEAMYYWYSIPKDVRDKCGKEGRKWALNDGNLSSTFMCSEMDKSISKTLEYWKPRKKFSMLTEKDYVGNKMFDKNAMGFIIPKINKDKIESEVKETLKKING